MSLVFTLIVPTISQAGFFDSMIDGMTETTNNLIDGATETTNNMIDTSGDVASEMLALMSKLSDDIGAMADRIGEMADRILVMADKIGEMADRIVETEKIMTDTMLQMQDQMNDLAAGTNAATASQVTLNTEYGSTVYGTPEIVISDGAGEYLLYVSGSMQMNDDAVSVLIRSQADLEKLWPQLVGLGVDGQIYIAVKSINSTSISSLSNVVMLNL